MRMGRVIGTVVATRKDPQLEGVKFLVVENLDMDLNPEGGYVVAVDAVGAGANEVVLYASGSSARQTELTRDRPADAVIMAILDSFEAHGKTTRLA
jgi:microcompartment protein CcmK/EutM